MKTLLSIIGLGLLGLGVFMISLSYKNYVNPKNIYGTWVEQNVMKSVQDVYIFNHRGVFLNDHLLTTKLKYDGTKIAFRTGEGKTVYLIAGTNSVPQLKRIQPSQPPQTLIRQQDDVEDTSLKKPRSNVIRPQF